jgi:murein DD-endopeptidase MepM/ murein hydrolase activator NlpD
MARPLTDLDAGREQLIDLVIEIIEERGSAAVTVTELAARANMSPASLYRYYESKEALIEAVAERWFQPMMAMMEAVIASDLPPRRKMYEFYARRFVHLRAMWERDPVAFATYCELGEEHFELVRSYIDLGDHYLGTIIGEAMADGHFDGLEIDEDHQHLLQHRADAVPLSQALRGQAGADHRCDLRWAFRAGSRSEGGEGVEGRLGWDCNSSSPPRAPAWTGERLIVTIASRAAKQLNVSPETAMIRAALTVVAALGAASQASAAEIRICEREIRAVALSDERGVQSALVQGIAVVNTGTEPELLKGVSFELKERGQVRDRRWLPASEIAGAARQSPQIGMLAQVFPYQFCSGELLAGAKLAATDKLAPGEALIFMHQPFTWQGTRDRIEISAETERGGLPYTAAIELPVVAGSSKTKLLFPVAGRTYVAVAASFHTPHRWASMEEFGLDILMLTGNGSTYRGKGSKLTDYAAFGKSVRAAAAGRVIAVRDGDADNAAMLKRPDETGDAYMARLQESQLALLAKGMAAVLGNHVVIDHGNGEFSMYAHLKLGSVGVKLGDKLGGGETIGLLGSSGNSTEPHLHFQVCDGPDIATCRPIPPNFGDYRLPFEFVPRTLQSGDIIETTR